jgi:hypothetical protein
MSGLFGIKREDALELWMGEGMTEKGEKGIVGSKL